MNRSFMIYNSIPHILTFLTICEIKTFLRIKFLKKTFKSFVKYIANIVENQFQITSIYVNNDGNDSLDILISKIIEATLNKYNSKALKSKIKDSLLNHVESINFQGSRIKFEENNED